MQPKYVLIAGSAAQDCDGEKLAMATQFVAAVTQEILRTGNSLAVLASREPTRAEPDGPVSLTFDWTALRTIAQHLEDSSENSGRILARVVTGADSIRKRFSPENARLIQLLQVKGAIDVRHIPANSTAPGKGRDRRPPYRGKPVLWRQLQGVAVRPGRRFNSCRRGQRRLCHWRPDVASGKAGDAYGHPYRLAPRRWRRRIAAPVGNENHPGNLSPA